MKIKDSLYNFFHFFDLFKIQVQFYLEGRKKQSSMTSLLLSTVLISFLFYQFFYSEFFIKMSPNVITQTRESNEQVFIDFNEDKQFFLIVIDRYSLERTIDQSIFTIEAKYYDHGQVKNKKIHPCTYSDLKNLMNEDYFYNFGYDKLFCMRNKTFSLHNSGEDKEWQFIQFLLYPCRNETSNITCKPIEIINRFLKSKSFSIAFQTVDIDAHNYKNPFLINFEPKAVVIDPDIKKYHSDYIRLAQVKTDDSWFVSGSSVRVQNGYMIDSVVNEYELRTNLSEPFINWGLLADKKQVICSRNYQKLPEAVASLAGTANLFWFFGFYFCQIANQVSSMKFIMNKLYDFERLKKSRIRKKTIPKNENTFKRSKFWLDRFNQKDKPFSSERHFKENIKSNIEPIENLTDKNRENKENLMTIIETFKKKTKVNEGSLNNLIINNKEMLNELNEIVIEMPGTNNDHINDKNDKMNTKNNDANENIFHDMQKKNPLKTNNSFKLNLFGYLKYIIKKSLCIGLNKKEKLIKKVEKIYRKKLDISDILLKLEEIEKIKCLILNSDQYQLFSHLKKSNFFVSEKPIVNGLLLKSYKKCINEQYSCRISNYLVENCDSKQLF